MFDLISFDLQTLVLIARGEKCDTAIPRQTAMDELYRRFEGLIVKAASVKKFQEDLEKEDLIQEAGLAFVETLYTFNGEWTTFPGYLRHAIYNHLINVCRREKFFKCVAFDETYVAPSPSFEDHVKDKTHIVLHDFLEQPNLMVKLAGLTLFESLIIWKIFHEFESETTIGHGMGVSHQYVNKLKKNGLNKLKVYLKNLH